jgi:membrane protease YdiL (CAAX protease family)
MKRPIILLMAYILLLALEMLFLNKYINAFGPIILFAYILYIFWDDISSADLNLLFKHKERWKTIYTYMKWTIIIQGLTNLLAQLVFGFAPMLTMQDLLILTPIVAVICSPVIEEVIFRKLIFGYLNTKVGFWFAAIPSSILFAVAHANYVGWLGFFLIGMFWSWIYKKTESIMIPIILHTFLNTIVFVVLSIKGS